MSIVRRATLVALLTAAVPCPSPGETITTLFADGFEAEVPNQLNALLFQWNITGTVDVLAGANVCADAGGTSNCLDLDGTDPAGGAIETKALFSLSPGAYRLSFDLAGSQRTFHTLTDTVTVSVGGYLLEAITMDHDDPFETLVFDFMVASAGSSRVRFAHEGADQVGLLLDNVWLANIVPDEKPEPIPRPVPESSTMWLLAPALGWLVLRRRSHKRSR